MLAVTRVNRCRFCTFAHTKAALKEGLTQDEVRHLLAGAYDDAPERERPAILFAEHWADMGGRPDSSAVDALNKTYGAEAGRIELVLRVIKTFNYLGNLVDYALFKVSFGHRGG